MNAVDPTAGSKSPVARRAPPAEGEDGNRRRVQWSLDPGEPMYEFEWHRSKAEANERKHGISFEEAATAFEDPCSLTIPDPDHSLEEDRFVLIGRTVDDRVVIVVHALRGETIRLISARRATPSERRAHEEA